MRTIFSFVFFIIFLTIFYSCENTTSENDTITENISSIDEDTLSIDEETPTTIEELKGNFFMQPLDKLMSLNMAPVKAYITIDFIDDEYCNVHLNSYTANLIASRRYKIIEEAMIFIDKNGVEKKYSITRNKQKVYLTSKDGIKWEFKNDLNDLYSENTLKRDAFLYPVLTEREREFGAEDAIVPIEDGITFEEHPLRMEARKRSYLDQF